MSIFTLAISYLATSNLPWFMDLTFQVPMQYCSLQHQTLLYHPQVSNNQLPLGLYGCIHPYQLPISALSLQGKNFLLLNKPLQDSFLVSLSRFSNTGHLSPCSFAVARYSAWKDVLKFRYSLEPLIGHGLVLSVLSPWSTHFQNFISFSGSTVSCFELLKSLIPVITVQSFRIQHLSNPRQEV